MIKMRYCAIIYYCDGSRARFETFSRSRLFHEVRASFRESAVIIVRARGYRRHSLHNLAPLVF